MRHRSYCRTAARLVARQAQDVRTAQAMFLAAPSLKRLGVYAACKTSCCSSKLHTYRSLRYFERPISFKYPSQKRWLATRVLAEEQGKGSKSSDSSRSIDDRDARSSWLVNLAKFGLAGLAIGTILLGTLSTSAKPFTLPFRSGTAPVIPSALEMKAPKDPVASGLTEEEIQNVQLFVRNTPSVVNIANIATRQSYYSMDLQEVPVGSGSGFIWDNKGHIVTNFHVIRGASDIKVALIDQSVFPATVISGDPDKDIAVLQLQCPPEKFAELKPVELGTSANLLVGQKVFAIGNPFGLDHTLTQGIVSGVGRELQVPGPRGVPIKNVIQTDAAINPGNSGGVLLDSKGRLIGINTAIADPTGRGASSGVGFAIPIDSVKGLVEQILKYGKIVRPTLGITIAPPQVLRQINQEGVLILDVPSGTPAAKAGLRGTYRDQSGKVVLGDVIQKLDGKDVKFQRDLFEALDDLRPGDQVSLVISRDGQQREVALTLGGRDSLPLDQ